MAFVEDLDAFFQLAGFAEDVTLDGTTVRGIFENDYSVAGDGLGMSNSLPTLTLPSRLVPANPVGKTLVRGTTTYTVAVHEPDGTGVSTLILERAS